MSEQIRAYPAGAHPDLPPPSSQRGIWGWLYHNLFSSPVNVVLTVLAALLMLWVVPPVANWAFIDADWVGDSREDCTRIGACWVYIKVWFNQLMYFRYPHDQLWRIHAAYVILAAVGALMFVPRFPYKNWIGAFLLFGYPVVAFALFTGGTFSFNLSSWIPFLLGLAGLVPLFSARFQKREWMVGYRRCFSIAAAAMLVWILFAPWQWRISIAAPYPLVETPLWGGLFLTLVIAISGIVASLPIGIVLALGRRSNMPVIRSICVAFIELWRGVPLITVLFMSSVMFPLFMPEGVNFDKLLRALAGVTLFSAAYMAEVIRGGLQAIPKGQYEGAQALGLNYWSMMGLVVLPQALKIVIPGIVNTFIGLFKDTTLVLIIGLFDFLGAAQAVSTNTDWLGFSIEGYVFVGFGFWVFCFGMSRYSQHLERRLHTGH